jgi:hypothetical protein
VLSKNIPENDASSATAQWMGFRLTATGLTRIRNRTPSVTL